jgi:plasmid stability protein
MANLTLTIDDDILKRARIHALQRGTSVNALVREYLQSLAHDDSELEAIASGIDEIADGSDARRGSRRWSREDLYEQRLKRR